MGIMDNTFALIILAAIVAANITIIAKARDHHIAGLGRTVLIGGNSLAIAGALALAIVILVRAGAL